jgi:hypothetical protein
VCQSPDTEPVTNQMDVEDGTSDIVMPTNEGGILLPK